MSEGAFKTALRAQALRNFISAPEIPYWQRQEPEGLIAFRGVTQDEMDYIRKRQHIKSTGAFSLAGEGTNFSKYKDDAESYVNFGRDDPAKTGRPTYVLHVRRSGAMELGRDGYLKAQKEIPATAITQVDRHNPDGSVTPLKWGEF